MVTFLALCAAAAAAVYAYKAYALEAGIGLVFKEREFGSPEGQKLEEHFLSETDLTRDLTFSHPDYYEARDVSRAIQEGEPAGVLIRIDLQNIGRSPIVDAKLKLRFNALDANWNATTRHIDSEVSVALIPSNESVILPIRSWLPHGFFINLLNVSQVVPSKRPNQGKRSVIPFLAAQPVEIKYDFDDVLT